MLLVIGHRALGIGHRAIKTFFLLPSFFSSFAPFAPSRFNKKIKTLTQAPSAARLQTRNSARRWILGSRPQSGGETHQHFFISFQTRSPFRLVIPRATRF